MAEGGKTQEKGKKVNEGKTLSTLPAPGSGPQADGKDHGLKELQYLYSSLGRGSERKQQRKGYRE